MTLTPNENGNDKPGLQPLTWRDVAGGFMLAGLILYVGCLYVGVI